MLSRNTPEEQVKLFRAKTLWPAFETSCIQTRASNSSKPVIVWSLTVNCLRHDGNFSWSRKQSRIHWSGQIGKMSLPLRHISKCCLFDPHSLRTTHLMVINCTWWDRASDLRACLFMLFNCSSSYTASLTSSVLAYRYENGRRYHASHDGGRDWPPLLIQDL